MRFIFPRQAVVAGLLIFVIALAARIGFTERLAMRDQVLLTQVAPWLRDMVIVLDPGHGGKDPGAVVGETREKELVLQIAGTLKQVLEQQGTVVVLTREQDVDLGGPIREELGRRVALVNQHKAALFISLHANKDRCNCWGAQTFYQYKGMPAGKELAEAIQTQLRQFTPTTRVALPANYFVLRTSPVPAAMVELGFLTNPDEHRRLKDPGYQKKIATAVAVGVGHFFRSQVPQAEAEGIIGE